MSDETPEIESPLDKEGPLDLARLLGIVTAAASVLGLLISMIALLLIHDARNELAELGGQARKMQKVVKGLAEDVAAMKPSAQVAIDKPAPVAALAPPVPTHIDAADTRGDCVIRSGDSKSLAGCINIEPKKH